MTDSDSLPTVPGDYRGKQFLWRLDAMGWWDTAGFSFEPTDAYIAADAPFERLLTRAEAGQEIQQRIAAVAPMGTELGHDGTEDPGMAAWVEGLRDAHGVVQEYIDGGGA